ncbi:hypothetical protein [Chitinophaga sp. sic0106]|uniref:hypothetical protein n=1 Tax=Chitinophaga sp. sic0106 TaxID=2854785 RepID=UPI001C438F02|nr:hypothetical protein [Chitinophaga sp. sic0106]MBV7529047.1 hypothetical protein [Chitinophaga sp. sic0106]
MIQYTPQDSFTDSDIYDLTDLVIGGTNGVSNTPIKALLDRTQYLYNRLGRYDSVKTVTGAYSYDIEADARSLFVVSLTDNSVFTLPDPSALPAGTPISLRTRYSAIKALTVQCSAGQIVGDDGVAVSLMYMHTGERLRLVANGSIWEVDLADGNFYTAGESFGGRKQMLNTAVLNGSTYNRADMPRLTSFGLSLTTGQGIVDDITWFSNPGGVPYYRGLFSTGNGTTTMRLPDERAMFDRYLDMGRGLDNDRFPNAPGGYAADLIKSHTLTVENMSRRGYPKQSGDRYGTQNNYFIDKDQDNWYKPLEVRYDGGGETRPKSIGKIPLIRY